jgi:hypothetical protein
MERGPFDGCVLLGVKRGSPRKENLSAHVCERTTEIEAELNVLYTTNKIPTA